MEESITSDSAELFEFIAHRFLVRLRELEMTRLFRWLGRDYFNSIVGQLFEY